MKTNSRQVIDAIHAHINEIRGGVKLSDIYSQFNSWYCSYERKRNPVEQVAFADWLMGLPSDFTVLYYTFDILKYMESIGLPLPANKNEDEGVRLYLWLIYREFKKMLGKEK